jgi:AP-4 complex subunit epsilon-1
MPAPWIQTKILECMAYLGQDDEQVSKQMYETITYILNKSNDYGINIGYALVYQCLKTITMIHPHQPLIDLASQTISRFLQSQSQNLKYIGIAGLASIVKIDPKYTLSYQSLVVTCLEDSDDTLKVKTLDLLFKMSNKQNVEAIVDRLLTYLKDAPIEAGNRKDLVNKISILGDKFAPNHTWYVKNMNKLFEIGGNTITGELTNKFIASISEYESQDDDGKFKESTVKIYQKILKKNANIPDALM